MTEVRFYHLTRTRLEKALPQMLEKTLARGQRAVVRAGSDERVEALNNWLWTYGERTFLPHGSARDGYPEVQPIWLTTEDENPNQAQVLFLTDGTDSDHLEDFTLCADLFDGTDDQAVAAARGRWTARKTAGHEVTYWRQTETGGWEQAA